MRILVVNDTAERRALGLAPALRRHGAVVVTAPLAAIGFDTDRPAGLAIPGFDTALPDAVLVRSIAAGSFEAVTRRLGVLHALAKLGVPVWNSAQAIERCVDKSTTTFLLQAAALPTPPTFAVEGRAEAELVVRRELPHGPLVLKPLFGAQGRGIRLIRATDDLPEPEAVNGVYYLQHYVRRAGPPFQDFRVFVCAGRALAMMSRSGYDWITNVSRGAVPAEAHDRNLAELAVAAAAAVGVDFGGVDIVTTADGRHLVLEVNSMPAWSGLQSVTAVNIAEAIADALLAFLAQRTGKAVAASHQPAPVPADA